MGERVSAHWLNVSMDSQRGGLKFVGLAVSPDRIAFSLYFAPQSAAVTLTLICSIVARLSIRSFARLLARRRRVCRRGRRESCLSDSELWRTRMQRIEPARCSDKQNQRGCAEWVRARRPRALHAKADRPSVRVRGAAMSVPIESDRLGAGATQTRTKTIDQRRPSVAHVPILAWKIARFRSTCAADSIRSSCSASLLST